MMHMRSTNASLALLAPTLVAFLFTLALCLPIAAYAQAEDQSDASVVLLGTPPLLADGRTESTLYLWVPGLREGRVRVRADAGKVRKVQNLENELVTFLYRPPAVEQPTRQSLSVEVQGSGIQALELVHVSTQPTVLGDLNLSVDPETYIQGTASVSVRASANGNMRVSPQARRLVAEATGGILQTPVYDGKDSWITRWTPPRSLKDHSVIILTMADATYPTDIWGWTAFPVHARQRVEYEVSAGSRNVLTMGDRSYGPTIASANGIVRFDVLVDPSRPQARLVSMDREDNLDQRHVTLPVPSEPVLTFLPLPHTGPADPRLEIPVRIVAVSPRGQPLRALQVKLTTTAGTITELEATDQVGVFEAILNPPRDPERITIEAYQDADHMVRTQLEATQIPPRLQIRPDPRILPHGERKATLTLATTTAAGALITDEPPKLDLRGASRLTGLEQTEQGTWQISVRRYSNSPNIAVLSNPATLGVEGQVDRILGWPVTDQ
ncbi:MAG: hypothetical protein QGG40_17845, partial [Myxococcota bacterium]|nr:hypothetical protein [Myxococcota bacterium]